MINIYRYGGVGAVEREGKKLPVQIPPRIALKEIGAFIDVIITHPRITHDSFIKKSKIVPKIMVKALVDTGASSTVITPRVADQLGLVHTGFQKVSSVQDEQERPVYYGFIIFPWGSGKEIPIVSCPLKNLDCLIGRDILMHWYFNYNGPDGSIVICD